MKLIPSEALVRVTVIKHMVAAANDLGLDLGDAKIRDEFVSQAVAALKSPAMAVGVRSWSLQSQRTALSALVRKKRSRGKPKV